MKKYVLGLAFSLIFAMNGLPDNVVKAAELRFLAVGDPATLTNFLNDIVIPQFEEEHGVKVIMDIATWDNRMDKILVSIAGGVPYDVIGTGYYSPYEEGAAGLLAPLDNYMARWDRAESFPPPLLEATKWNGRIYHIPHYNDLRGIAYNKRLFAESGFDPNLPPGSWEDLTDAARRLTRVQDGRVSVRGLNIPDNPANAAQYLFWFIQQAGTSEIDVSNFTSNLNQPEARDALYVINELAEIARVQEVPFGSTTFDQERAAMQAYNPFSLFNLRERNPDLIHDFGVFAPRHSSEFDPVAQGFVNGLAILNESRNKDLAWQFITAIHDDEARITIERTTGFLSGRADMLGPMLDLIPEMELYFQLFSHLKPPVIPPPRNIAQTEIGNYIQQVLRGRMAPEAALIQGHEIWSRLLREWNETLNDL